MAIRCRSTELAESIKLCLLYLKYNTLLCELCAEYWSECSRQKWFLLSFLDILPGENELPWIQILSPSGRRRSWKRPYLHEWPLQAQ